MEYRKLGSAGINVSPVCLGTMMFGGPTNEADSTRIIHKALDGGINFIDTADIYNAGESEVVALCDVDERHLTRQRPKWNSSLVKPQRNTRIIEISWTKKSVKS